MLKSEGGLMTPSTDYVSGPLSIQVTILLKYDYKANSNFCSGVTEHYSVPSTPVRS